MKSAGMREVTKWRNLQIDSQLGSHGRHAGASLDVVLGFESSLGRCLSIWCTAFLRAS